MSRLLAACRRQPVDRPPVWLMRQAGRYLPEYQKVRRQAGDFLTMCRTPALAAELTLQPVRRFELDAAIVFSDILTALVPLGVELDFTPGPHLGTTLERVEDIDRLRPPHPWRGTEFLGETLERVRSKLDPSVALIGFCGAPWTLATYLIEGTTSRSCTRTKAFALKHPRAFDRLLALLADAMAAYLADQVGHGAEVVQLFDSWVGVLGAEDARRWALGPARRLLSSLEGLGVPRIYFAHGGTHLLHFMPDLPCEVVGLDWRADLGRAARILPGHAIQGNLDPAVLMAPRAEVRRRTLAMLAQAPRVGYVANLGHGVTPEVPVAAVAAFVRTVQEYAYADPDPVPALAQRPAR